MCQSFLFCIKQSVKKCLFKSLFLRGMYVKSTNGSRVFVIFHTKQVQSGSEMFDIKHANYAHIQFDTPPNLAYHKPWLTESSGAHQQSQTMGECLFYFVFNIYWSNQLSFLVTSTLCMQVERYLNSVWKITNPLLLLHELNRNIKQELF